MSPKERAFRLSSLVMAGIGLMVAMGTFDPAGADKKKTDLSSDTLQNLIYEIKAVEEVHEINNGTRPEASADQQSPAQVATKASKSGSQKN